MSSLQASSKPQQGSHQRFTDLPYDCIWEICEELQPLDLLHLSRLSPQLRSQLLSKSSRRLWQAALNRIEGLPECPPGMSEPQYTNLAFSLQCHHCLEPCTRDTTTDWDLRVRLCPPCSKRLLFEFNEDEPPYFVSDVSVKIRDLIPVRPPTPFGCAALKNSFLRAQKEFESGSDALKGVYVAERREAMVVLRTYARESRVWEAGIIQRLKADRAKSIWDRLWSLQWRAELKIMSRYKFDQLPLVDRAQVLTEEVWSDIQPELEAHLLAVRKEAAIRNEKRLLAKAEQ
ncbi:hypothetical protein DFH09DRAFT_1366146 [Mycena vulgaris]|nr:hypothetical protein DFH09DRAFT_1366146 [Mycena vulgaris]